MSRTLVEKLARRIYEHDKRAGKPSARKAEKKAREIAERVENRKKRR